MRISRSEDMCEAPRGEQSAFTPRTMKVVEVVDSGGRCGGS